MQQKIFMEKYPIFELTLNKDEAQLTTAQEVIAYLKQQVEAHPLAKVIGEFDHLTHTQSINGEIADGILAAQHLVFCFGTKLPNAQVMAVRPRSIGVTEFTDRLVITFMEPPMPVATETMTKWVLSLKKTQSDL
jgi:hypothetical protein